MIPEDINERLYNFVRKNEHTKDELILLWQFLNKIDLINNKEPFENDIWDYLSTGIYVLNESKRLIKDECNNST